MHFNNIDCATFKFVVYIFIYLSVMSICLSLSHANVINCHINLLTSHVNLLNCHVNLLTSHVNFLVRKAKEFREVDCNTKTSHNVPTIFTYPVHSLKHEELWISGINESPSTE